MTTEPQLAHVPVMVREVLEWLRPETGGPYWDLTLGAGGHLAAYLERAPGGTAAFALDGDPAALERAAHLPATLVHGDLGDLARIAAAGEWPAPRAVLMDVGLSSPQVDDPERGFSFRNDGPLDMRMDPTHGPTAAEWLEDVSQDELSQVLRELGEERYSGRIARVIKERVPLDTTTELCEAVLAAIPRRSGRASAMHPARRTFQAIRIAVNRELERMQAGLEAAIDALAVGGRVVILSYHSGEDRVAKTVIRRLHQAKVVHRLTKKPLTCTSEEADHNPRARSAKLRAAEKR